MAWLAVDERNFEWIFEGKPIRLNEGYYAKFGTWNGGNQVELPKGTILYLTGHNMSYENMPIELVIPPQRMIENNPLE